MITAIGSNGNLPIVVLIPTHNRLPLLERTVDSVLACIPPADRLVRLVVIENGGKFGVEEILAKKSGWVRPEYYYFSKPNKSDALNSFIQTLDNSFILFFDDDIRVDEEILVKYSNVSHNLRSGRFFGGGMLVDYEEPPPPWLIGHLPPSAKGWHPNTYAVAPDNMAFMGCNWAAYSSDIKAAGGFNPQFGPGGVSGGTGQETVMQLSLLKIGCEGQYIKDALVWHYVPKARCSVRWTLSRIFRMNITIGHSLQQPDNYRNIGGLPIWMIRLATKQGLEVVGSWFQADPVVRFNKMHRFLTTYGRIIGIRARHKNHTSGND